MARGLPRLPILDPSDLDGTAAVGEIYIDQTRMVPVVRLPAGSAGTGASGYGPELAGAAGDAVMVPSLGGIYRAVTPVAFADSPYSVVSTDYSLLVTDTADTVTIALPAATGSGRVLNIKKISSSANKVVVNGDSAETIDGEETFDLLYQWQSVTIQDGASGAWYIL